MWATWPSVLKNYARHHETGEPMPQALVDKFLAAEQFNQGYATTEYLAASILTRPGISSAASRFRMTWPPLKSAP